MTRPKKICCLNPYSTGSNSNKIARWKWLGQCRLNPYSTGSNSNFFSFRWRSDYGESLNPYSTGSNSNQSDTAFIVAGTVLILILLEVTQIRSDCTLSVFSKCLNPYSTGSNSNFSMDGCLCRYWRMS